LFRWQQNRRYDRSQCRYCTFKWIPIVSKSPYHDPSLHRRGKPWRVFT